MEVGKNIKPAAEEKTNKATAVFYSFGEVGSQLSWYMINTYLMIFYTDIVGLAAGAISLIMLIARIVQAVSGPVWGLYQDGHTNKHGKFRAYLMFLPPFLAIFNILTFTVFPVGGILKAVLCLVFYILTGLLYVGVGNAYSSLVNVIAYDSQVRMNYSSARSIASSVIGIILSAVAMPMILFFSHGSKADASGYFWTTVICSLVMVPMLVLCGYKCKEVVKFSAEGQSGTAPKVSIGKSLKMLAQNKMLLIVVATTFFGAMGTMLRMSMLSYYVIYVVGSFKLVAPVMTVLTVGQLLGSLALAWGTKTFGKKRYMIYNNAIQIIAMVLLFILPASNMFFLIGLNLVIGITNAAANITFGMMSDTIEYGDWKYGVRNVGLSVSTLQLSVQAATAITGAAGVLLLSATGYVANQAQSASAITGINILVNLLPAGLALLSLLVLLFYKIDAQMLDTIKVDLENRGELKK
ncbi:MFS transporter [Lactobacillus agilis]|uniref:MFS transporter n=1 Tax=Ligilactobacillus agilis TaxID=1601 RepID=UPI0014303DFC|nr:glycoside-pentoside-hexuronide (GPH):cation symporter [Ligilactobacillus agilis]NJE32720.1 MFS transporter [Ligilactobacillus agilis]